MLVTGRWGYFIGATTHPAPKDPDHPTTVEMEEALQWDREDAIASYLLSERLPSDINLDIEYLSRLTTLWQAVGDDEGLEVEVIDIEQEVGKGKAEDAESK